ncbi:MAG: serine/threonine protein kinase, partial [Phycisphaerales bacterium]|nr:serine/threonine protein kinase [Phycisphaerales bacterium]
ESTHPTVAGYEIGEEIGRGGFGIVYRARQRSPIDRAVAVKVLRRELVSDDAVQRFRAESALLARMSHPGIARVYDAGLTDQGQPFVAMEFIDAQPLLEACESRTLGVRQRVALLADVCDAIQHAHQRAVIHRDLKPANILVERRHEDVQPRVIDFGIAKLLDDDPASATTRAQVRLGTPRYMSPEQRDGENTADTRIDVYALGAILCEMLAGDVPNAPTTSSSRSTSLSRPSRIASQQSSTTLTHPRTLKGDLDRIVLKACDVDPDRRYPSAQALGDDLRRYLSGQPVTASPPGVFYLGRKFVSRHRTSVALASILGIALVMTAAFATLKWSEARDERDKARASTARASFIGDFLLEMLMLTVDNNSREAPPALTETALQDIADRAAEGLDEDPDHMLPMLANIGQFQSQSGDPKGGAATIRQALDFAIDLHGIPSQEVIDLRLSLYDLLWGHGMSGTTEQIERAREEAAALFDEDDPRRLRVLQRGDVPLEELERIARLYDEVHGGLDDIEPSDRLHVLFTLGMAQRFSDHPERQVETTRRLYEVATAHFPPKHTAVIDAMSMYGEALSTYAPSE